MNWNRHRTAWSNTWPIYVVIAAIAAAVVGFMALQWALMEWLGSGLGAATALAFLAAAVVVGIYGFQYGKADPDA